MQNFTRKLIYKITEFFELPKVSVEELENVWEEANKEVVENFIKPLEEIDNEDAK